MRGRDRTHVDSDDGGIINPDGETAEYLKATLDAEWADDDPGVEDSAE